ncbi:peptidyl-prolyl cis-trans isomerase [Lutimonas halocynthiae]|uniref:peptidyl-prolyl cis-trans isomerase n=1 Tax=Lutimonas halocynthiae TaxID=1446477 RepID=UPI0025B5EEAA|nr:peptidyl-prolyl cis-trans isomerase [Lutimonas halocynthiae]MDN3643873.1 peptidyl-prolyl cis-trans isomerase [Lutimonas halocynthiae]
MKKLLKEPLFHFLLMGIGLFIIYGIVSNDQTNEETIVINDFDVDNIIASWEMQWKRLPTDEELKSLILQNIKQEIFYQEALKMNLDHNDEIIKRRLSQKMQFLSSDIASLNEPNDDEILAFYKDNIESYMSQNSYELYQIIYSLDYHNNPKAEAKNMLQSISQQDPKMAENLGDKMPFPFYFKSVDESELNRQLGLNFTDELEKIEVNQWTGPIQSGFGYHLVFIADKKESAPIPFNDIQADVLRDLEYENQKKMNEMIFEEFRKNYNIEYDLNPDKFDDSFIEFLKNNEVNNIDG